MSRISHIHATEAAGKAFFSKGVQGSVVMLNLLKFRAVADYSKSPELAPDEPISGEAAYLKYMQSVRPILLDVGADLLFRGKPHEYLIGPSDEDWDLLLLIKYSGADKLIALSQHEEYQKIIGHRTAALLDSRLLPIEKL